MEKRIIGAILTLLGVAGLVIGAVQFAERGSGTGFNMRSKIMYAALGLIFFFAGVTLIRTTHDQAR